MDAGSSLAWLALLGLGALHGLNPGMGWLFAVSLGLQRQSRSAVWEALGPLALGHALAVGVAIGTAALLGLALPAGMLRWLVAAALGGFGIFHLLRHRHPRWGGMRIGKGDLALWSFLMATGHGAGLMALPFALTVAATGPHAEHHQHLAVVAAGQPGGWTAGLLAALVHALGYLAVTGAIAVIVVEKLGLRMLRRAWINLDLIWGGALIVTAAVTLLA